jgi:3-(3-hydroxy-phenyl)propionate hydroxylase
VLGRWATADERVLRAALAPYYPMIEPAPQEPQA